MSIDLPIEHYLRTSLNTNGINIKKLPDGLCVISEVNTLLVLDKTTQTIKEGDIVTKINNIPLKDFLEIDINKMLSHTILTTILSSNIEGELKTFKS